jgi:hypothetical protein
MTEPAADLAPRVCRSCHQPFEQDEVVAEAYREVTSQALDRTDRQTIHVHEACLAQLPAFTLERLIAARSIPPAPRVHG